MMKKLINGFLDTNRATKLMIFATLVGSVRFMLLHAVAVDFELWAWFGMVEVISGIAFAVLEGVALAYVSKRWRRLEPETWTAWLYWVILAIGQLALLLAITWTTGMAFVATRSGATIDTVLGATGAAWWSMLVAGINPLIVLLIGIVEDEDVLKVKAETDNGEGGLYIPEAVQADVFLDQWYTQHQREPLPPEMAHYFEQATGRAIDEAQADSYILAWRKAKGRVGRRPETPTLTLNGNGVH